MNDNEIKDFLRNNENLLRQNNLNKLYEEWGTSKDTMGNELTEFFLKANINPLDYFKKEIPEYCFYSLNNTPLQINIPKTIEIISDAAFQECTNLTSISIPDSVTSIGKKAFYYCSKLTDVTLGTGVTTISDSAFADCSNLTNITIPDSVTSIGEYAFSYCINLTSIIIPDGVTTIGSGIFIRCPNLKSIKYKGKEFTNSKDFYDYLK